MTVAEPSSRPEGRLIEVVHQTAYQYRLPVEQSWQLAHLRPRPLDRQTVRSHRIEIDPVPDWIEEGRDYFGNPETRFAIHSAHRALTVTTTSLVEVYSGQTALLAAGLPSNAGQRLARAQLSSPSPQVPCSFQRLPHCLDTTYSHHHCASPSTPLVACFPTATIMAQCSRLCPQ